MVAARIMLEGEKFGEWSVIKIVSDNRNRHSKVLCKCSCGKERTIWKTHLVHNKSTSCGCKNQDKVGSKHKDWKGFGQISGNFWNSIRRGASGSKGKRATLEFSISIEDAWNKFESQNGKCALTGIELNLNYASQRYRSRHGIEHTASLDRIDSSLGYTVDNIQWVHKDINMMKRTYDQDYFIEMCKKVAEQNRK